MTAELYDRPTGPEEKRITIERLDSGEFSVAVGELYTLSLTFEEALGLVAQLLLEGGGGPALHWLQPREAHQRWYASLSMAHGTENLQGEAPPCSQ